MRSNGMALMGNACGLLLGLSLVGATPGGWKARHGRGVSLADILLGYSSCSSHVGATLPILGFVMLVRSLAARV